jgi:3-deoxy-D-manno-octulosonic acid (KDO) 8-phosphate synthase
MKLRDFKIDNNEKMTQRGGMNVLESRDWQGRAKN